MPANDSPYDGAVSLASVLAVRRKSPLFRLARGIFPIIGFCQNPTLGALNMDWNLITQNWDEMIRRMRPTSSLTSTYRAKPSRSNPVNGLEETSKPISQAIAATPDA
jgi:hypothetical protein